MAQSWIVIFVYCVLLFGCLPSFLFPTFFSTSDSCQCYSQETITSTINTIKISYVLIALLLVELIFSFTIKVHSKGFFTLRLLLLPELQQLSVSILNNLLSYCSTNTFLPHLVDQLLISRVLLQ